MQEGVDAANAKLARVEQIKYFTIVEGDWLPGGDELTPTMKLKRKPIAEKYAEEIVDAISGNICRCTGYAQIVEAIALAAERMRGQNTPAEEP